MPSIDHNYFPDVSIRAVVAELAARFTLVESAKSGIVERSLQIIMNSPEIDLTDPVRELLPVVRQVALDQFKLDDGGHVCGSGHSSNSTVLS
ncbi:hypothetical protein EYC79_07740 [Agrobacterium cavarae]|uniref:Uncharacterized protein n=1 Tax=Agrobacterium cavarae TaxID=2528239 RepID=A0ABY1YAE0_9HYPH|nr:hypothetical protein [Agrobacterium cavarae]TBN14898.1 hypothetical protein EYC79_07740 [Agrobacterium cavarae]